MTVYWLTFRLHEETMSGRSYEQRYEALYKAVDEHSSKWWLDPTSFIALESQFGIGTIAAACKAAIAPSHDLVLIREMNTKSALLVGHTTSNTIFELMPYLKNL